MANKKKAAAATARGIVGVRFTEGERDEVERAAETDSRTLSAFIRKAALQVARAVNESKR